MRLLANENIPAASVAALRDTGHDVLSLSEESSGVADEIALRLARDQDRILITFDRDYGELIFARGLPCPPGVIYLRFVPATPTESAEIISALLARHGVQVAHHFLVVERDSFRRRPLPVST